LVRPRDPARVIPKNRDPARVIPKNRDPARVKRKNRDPVSASAVEKLRPRDNAMKKTWNGHSKVAPDGLHRSFSRARAKTPRLQSSSGDPAPMPADSVLARLFRRNPGPKAAIGGIERGGVFVSRPAGRPPELAQVLDVQRDEFGIGHVHFRLYFQYQDRLQEAGARTLALPAFRQRFSERHQGEAG
jgi:hypothetical protein